MERRKMLTMNWDGLGDNDDEDESFFETRDRTSSADPLDLASSSDEEDGFEDSRTSFSSTISTIPSETFKTFSQTGAVTVAPDYEMWMASPGSITERRKRLLFGMGLDENKELLRVQSAVLDRAISKKFENGQNLNSSPASTPATSTTTKDSASEEPKTERSLIPFVLVRSRSDGDIDLGAMNKCRKDEFIGNISKQRLTRTATEIAVPRSRICPYPDGSRVVAKDAVRGGVDGAGQSNQHGRKLSSVKTKKVEAFFLIKNLDTGKEFIVNEYGEDGMWNRLSDLQTGKKLTMEEFEKTVGHSPVVKELMSREKVGRSSSDGCGYDRKLSTNSYFSKSLRMSKRTGAALLKNIKGVASGFIGDREREDSVKAPVPQGMDSKPRKNEWVRVRQSGKSHRELSALHLCQEFQAHEGCIWSIKFSGDGQYLASAGEDRVIHVWEVQECEVMSLKPEEGNLTPIHPSLLGSQDRNGIAESPPSVGEKKKKGKFGSKRGNVIPDYVHVPETVFSLSDKPYCSFQGHSDDVLDLSWSKSQLLLSSSMDKTVRLWDLETKGCLKMFAHNDYVTCIQFNPIDDDYFISGSLDAKVRIWNIPERQVVDWIDTHEMVTAISYTPNGQAALVGTQKGSCRMYSTKDCRLSQIGRIELRNKKKSQLRKVTGFEFVPGNPSEVLVTSADSRIRIVDGSKVIHKFVGFRNADSQFAASFSPNGKYVITASEDSQVYVWRHEEGRNGSSGKARHLSVTRSHEHFQCKDVSVAIPWPCTIKGDPPVGSVHHSKRHSKRLAVSSPSNSGSPNKVDDTSNKRTLPPLPKKRNNHGATESVSASPEEDHEDRSAISRTDSGIGDSFANNSSKKKWSPFFKKNGRHHHHSATENSLSPLVPPTEEEDPEALSRTYSGIGDSFSSAGSASMRFGDSSPSISPAAAPSSASWSSSWSLLFESSHATPAVQPSAWGLVIVTAGFGGEIRCYQNFGLPRRI